MAATQQSVTVTVYAKPFSNASAKLYEFRVVNDDVLVFDDVAFHFTRVHSLSESDKKRVLWEVKVQSTEISDDEIKRLRSEAWERNDHKLVDFCDLALLGYDEARTECARAILEGQVDE